MTKPTLMFGICLGFACGIFWNLAKDKVAFMKLEQALIKEQATVDRLESDRQKLAGAIKGRDALVKELCDRYPSTKPKPKNPNPLSKLPAFKPKKPANEN